MVLCTMLMSRSGPTSVLTTASNLWRAPQCSTPIISIAAQSWRAKDRCCQCSYSKLRKVHASAAFLRKTVNSHGSLLKMSRNGQHDTASNLSHPSFSSSLPPFRSHNAISRQLQPNRRFVTKPDEEEKTGTENSIITPSLEDVDERVEPRKEKQPHVPVMVHEVLRILQPVNGQVIVDMTFGAGGHAKEILKHAPEVRYFACDRDPLAYEHAVELAKDHSQITPVLSRFSELPVHLLSHGVSPSKVDAFLFDLGASSMQFDTAKRGFSLSKDGPLDMRMDGDRFPDMPTAADVINSLQAPDLAHVLKKYGEEKQSLQIAHAVVEARYAFGNFSKTSQLAEVVKTVFQSGAFRHDKLYRQAHVATKTFQALRIFVNDELNELNNGLEVAVKFLKPGGVCCVISFHSLEDRIVKRHFHDIDMNQPANVSIHGKLRNDQVSFDVDFVKDEYLAKQWKPISRKVLEPSEEECFANPRSRSAKLRAAIKSEGFSIS